MRARPRDKFLPNKLPSKGAWILGAFSALLALAGALAMSLGLPPSGPLRFATVEVPSGSGAGHIGNILKDAQVIRSAVLFDLAARAKGLSSKLQAGEYRFSTRDSLLDVLDRLAHGEVLLHKVTLPEGRTLKEVASALEEAGLASSEKFLKAAGDAGFVRGLGIPSDSLEGYLSPESYSFPRNFGEKNILKAMVARFQKVLPAGFADKAKALGLTSHQAVILASLVEHEARLSQERPVISGVFLNRLKKDMKLESCATIYHVLGYRKPRLYEKDLRTRSPYNTYLNKGLPPGPICSPGLEALNAAVNPESSDLLFFVARGDGSHEFTSDYQEHLKAKSRIEGGS